MGFETYLQQKSIIRLVNNKAVPMGFETLSF